MKLKYISSILFSGLMLTTLTTFTACNDFLDREPEDKVTPEKFFQAESDLADYAIKYYDFSTLNPGSYGMGTFADDNATDNQAGVDYSNYWVPGNWQVPANSSKEWNFEQIHHCNYFFEKVLPKYQAGTLKGNPDNIKHYIGEVYFLRAKAYFDNRPRNVNIFRMMFLGLPGHTLLCKRALINLLPPIESPVFKVTLYDAVLSIIAASYDSIVYCNKVLVNFRRHAAATTYNDYSSSLPSWRNALTELTWSLNHYKEIRKKVVPIFQGKLMLMEGLHSNIHDFIEAREAMRMETKQGVFAFLRLQYLLTKNYKKLFHTSGGGPIKLLRAMLYPIMQLYMYH